MKKKLKKIIIPTILIFLIVFVVLTIFTVKNYYKEKNKEIFTIEDRTKNIEANQKYNNDLYEINSWIRVQGTKIDVPVLSYIRRNNESIEMKLDNYGWQADVHNELVNKETIIGHNILNLSAHPGIGVEYYKNFEDLMGFVYYDFAKDNLYVQYTIDGENYVYKIFSVFFDDVVKMVNDQSMNNVSKKKLKKMIKRYQKESYYKYDVDVDENDKIITLDTCTRFFGDTDQYTFTVHARLLREGEKMNNYKVEKTNNYKKIEKILKEKGEEENEEI